MSRKPRAYICPIFRPDGVTALAVIRRQKGLTQEQLAEMVGMTSTAIIGYEGGYRTRPNTAQKIANALGVDLGELWIVEVADTSSRMLAKECGSRKEVSDDTNLLGSARG